MSKQRESILKIWHSSIDTILIDLIKTLAENREAFDVTILVLNAMRTPEFQFQSKAEIDRSEKDLAEKYGQEVAHEHLIYNLPRSMQHLLDVKLRSNQLLLSNNSTKMILDKALLTIVHAYNQAKFNGLKVRQLESRGMNFINFKDVDSDFGSLVELLQNAKRIPMPKYWELTRQVNNYYHLEIDKMLSELKTAKENGGAEISGVAEINYVLGIHHSFFLELSKIRHKMLCITNIDPDKRLESARIEFCNYPFALRARHNGDLCNYVLMILALFPNEDEIVELPNGFRLLEMLNTVILRVEQNGGEFAKFTNARRFDLAMALSKNSAIKQQRSVPLPQFLVDESRHPIQVVRVGALIALFSCLDAISGLGNDKLSQESKDKINFSNATQNIARFIGFSRQTNNEFLNDPRVKLIFANALIAQINLFNYYINNASKNGAKNPLENLQRAYVILNLMTDTTFIYHRAKMKDFDLLKDSEKKVLAEFIAPEEISNIHGVDDLFEVLGVRLGAFKKQFPQVKLVDEESNNTKALESKESEKNYQELIAQEERDIRQKFSNQDKKLDAIIKNSKKRISDKSKKEDTKKDNKNDEYFDNKEEVPDVILNFCAIAKNDLSTTKKVTLLDEESKKILTLVGDKFSLDDLVEITYLQIGKSLMSGENKDYTKAKFAYKIMHNNLSQILQNEGIKYTSKNLGIRCAKYAIEAATCCHITGLSGIKEAMSSGDKFSNRIGLMVEALEFINDAMKMICDVIGFDEKSLIEANNNGNLKDFFESNKEFEIASYCCKYYVTINNTVNEIQANLESRLEKNQQIRDAIKDIMKDSWIAGRKPTQISKEAMEFRELKNNNKILNQTIEERIKPLSSQFIEYYNNLDEHSKIELLPHIQASKIERIEQQNAPSTKISSSSLSLLNKSQESQCHEK